MDVNLLHYTRHLIHPLPHQIPSSSPSPTTHTPSRLPSRLDQPYRPPPPRPIPPFMGVCGSKVTTEQAVSNQIDKTLEEDGKRTARDCKILLLGGLRSAAVGIAMWTDGALATGAGESGKSTIVKQMKIIHLNGYTPQALLFFRPVVYKNLVESTQDVILAMKKLSMFDSVERDNRVRSHCSSRPFPWQAQLTHCSCLTDQRREDLGICCRVRSGIPPRPRDSGCYRATPDRPHHSSRSGPIPHLLPNGLCRIVRRYADENDDDDGADAMFPNTAVSSNTSSG